MDLIFQRRKIAVFVLLWLASVATTPAVYGLTKPNDRLSELRAIEAKVQSVVARNMESCVSITDFRGSGSGVIVSPDGLVLTAGHVIAGPRKVYEVRFPSGRVMKAVKLGMNLNVDAGMIQILDAKDLPYVELSEVAPQLGDWTVSLGHSGGFELGRKPPVRTGKFLKYRDYQLVTDAALIGGDSGGPLFNLDGKLIGIHSSIGGTIAENRHVRVDIFRQHWDRMKKGDVWGQLPELEVKRKRKYVQRPKLGVTVDVENNNGLVLSVREGSPAAKAGIQPNDQIIEFDGTPVLTSRHLIDLIKTKDIGQRCQVKIRRQGTILSMTVRMETLTP